VLKVIVNKRVTALILGAVAVVVGIVLLSSTEVKCGNRVMQEGQVCETTRNGSTVTRTYSEQKSDDQRMGYLALGFGVVALLVGAAGFALNARSGQPRPV
jgi:L,D-peptidoglycan transpeptidase YkuD (ErfK/YbiS/YcfS/YnhG family)